MERVSRRALFAGRRGSEASYFQEKKPKEEKPQKFDKQRRGSNFQSFEFEFEFSNLEVLEFVMKSFSFLISVLVYVL